MKNIMPAIGLFLVIVLFSVPAEINAQQQSWWMTNSLKLDSLSSKTLFHAEGEYSFSHLTGNVNMYVHRGSPAVFVRKGRFLMSSFGRINYQKMQTGDNPATRARSFMMNTKLIYDLVPVLQSETGILWERDENQFIDRRVVLYTGLIYNFLESKKFGKMFFGAVGYQHARSTEFLPLLPVTDENKPVVYAQQRLVVRVFYPVLLIENFSYIKELDKDAAYRTDLSFRAQVPVTKHISVVATHQTKYESQPLIHVLAPYFEKFNTTFTLGVKLNF